MIDVEIYIDEGLRFFVEKAHGTAPLRISFSRKRSVKDLLESIGIPHVEAGEIRLNGVPAGPESLLVCSGRLEVCSPGPGLPADGGKLSGDKAPLFILDVHLGRLAVNLRMLGFDVDYSNDRDDSVLAELASAPGDGALRLLLSCDRGLLKRRAVRAGMLVRSRDPVEQAAEVIRRFDLAGMIAPFSRCLICGGALSGAGGLDELSGPELLQVPSGVRVWCSAYRRCGSCGRIYWDGCHVERMRKKIENILELAKV